MLELILASSNDHKAQEFSELFSHNLISVKPSTEKLSVIEDGDTFHENALKKAQSYYNKFNKPIISDDSGIIVESLPDELGIHSARFGGENLTDPQRAELLLKKLDNQINRQAYFICILCIYLSTDEYYFFEGRFSGTIGHELKGKDGFGYDPVFHPNDYPDKTKTIAQIPDWKQAHSHRAQACKFAEKFFKERNCQS